MWRVWHKLFEWDYIYYQYQCVVESKVMVARIRKDYLGRPFFKRKTDYSKRVITFLRWDDTNTVVFLTCHPVKYFEEALEYEYNQQQ